YHRFINALSRSCSKLLKKCKYLIGKHDCSGYEGTAIVRGVDLARHSPLLQQQVPLAATWLPPGK
ncbi:MAG: hypothetical protein ACK559_01825, partial [bacterium]